MSHDFFTKLIKLASYGKWLPMKEKKLSYRSANVRKMCHDKPNMIKIWSSCRALQAHIHLSVSPILT